jgi:hypothetical protein
MATWNIKRPITIYIDESGEPKKIETDGLFHQRHNEGVDEGEWTFTFLVEGLKHEIDFYLGVKEGEWGKCMWIQIQDKQNSPTYRTLKSVFFKPLISGGETLEVMRKRAAEVKKWIERYT